MDTEEQVVSVVNIGRRKVLSKKQTVCFNFNDFEGLKSSKKAVSSPSTRCLGQLWSLEVHPGNKNIRHSADDIVEGFSFATGRSPAPAARSVPASGNAFSFGSVPADPAAPAAAQVVVRNHTNFSFGTTTASDSSSDLDLPQPRPGFQSVFLRRVHNRSINDKDDIDVKVSLRASSIRHDSPKRLTLSVGQLWGVAKFAALDNNMNLPTGLLVDGTLTIKVDIQVYQNKPYICAPQGTTLKQDIVSIFQSKDFSDVTFVVGGEEFHAHRLILAIRAPCLAALADSVTKDTAIQVDGVTPSLFRSLLHFIYLDELPAGIDIKHEALGLLEVADKFEFSKLKFRAEAELTKNGITVETAADMLLLADAKNCALLKEAAIDFFLANRNKVKASIGYSRVKESAKLLSELMDADDHPLSFEEDGICFERMRVSALRRKLNEMGMEVDGTREMLVRRLEAIALDENS